MYIKYQKIYFQAALYAKDFNWQISIDSKVLMDSQMIFGTEISNGNFMNNGYPQHNPQMNSMGQVPNNNPWLNQRPNQGFVTTPTVDEQQSIFLKPTTIEEVRKKWADFDWTQYVTVNPTTIVPENEPTVTPPNRPHAGEGIIQVRNGV